LTEKRKKNEKNLMLQLKKNFEDELAFSGQLVGVIIFLKRKQSINIFNS
jgi:hypothetical protein